MSEIKETNAQTEAPYEDLLAKLKKGFNMSKANHEQKRKLLKVAMEKNSKFDDHFYNNQADDILQYIYIHIGYEDVFRQGRDKGDQFCQDIELPEDKNQDPTDPYVIFFQNCISKANLAQIHETWKVELDSSLENNNFFNYDKLMYQLIQNIKRAIFFQDKEHQVLQGFMKQIYEHIQNLYNNTFWQEDDMVCDNVLNAVMQWLNWASTEKKFRKMAFECMSYLYVHKFERNTMITPLMLKASPSAVKQVLRSNVNQSYKGQMRFLFFLLQEAKSFEDNRQLNTKPTQFYQAIPQVQSKGYFQKIIVTLSSVDIKEDRQAQEFQRSYLEESVSKGSIDWWHVDLTFLDLVPNFNESIGNLATNEERKQRLDFILSIPQQFKIDIQCQCYIQMLENVRIDKARAFILDDIRRRITSDQLGEKLMADKVNKNKIQDICLKFLCKTEGDQLETLQSGISLMQVMQAKEDKDAFNEILVSKDIHDEQEWNRYDYSIKIREKLDLMIDNIQNGTQDLRGFEQLITFKITELIKLIDAK